MGWQMQSKIPPLADLSVFSLFLRRTEWPKVEGSLNQTSNPILLS